MNPTPKQCLMRWLDAKADELQRNARNNAPGYDLLRYQAEAAAQDIFNNLDNIAMIEALDFGRVLLEADALLS